MEIRKAINLVESAFFKEEQTPRLEWGPLYRGMMLLVARSLKLPAQYKSYVEDTAAQTDEFFDDSLWRQMQRSDNWDDLLIDVEDQMEIYRENIREWLSNKWNHAPDYKSPAKVEFVDIPQDMIKQMIATTNPKMVAYLDANTEKVRAGIAQQHQAYKAKRQAGWDEVFSKLSDEQILTIVKNVHAETQQHAIKWPRDYADSLKDEEHILATSDIEAAKRYLADIFDTKDLAKYM